MNKLSVKTMIVFRMRNKNLSFVIQVRNRYLELETAVKSMKTAICKAPAVMSVPFYNLT